MNALLRQLLMLPQQASTIARDIDYLHYFVIIVTMIGAAGVAALSLYYIAYYRRGTGRGDPAPDARPHRTSGGISHRTEAVVFGGLLSLFVLWWVIGFRQFVRIAEPPPDSLTIYVVAKQWMWTFAYPHGGGSNGVLYVPVGRSVKLVMTSRDVIHSFYVPDFRLKRDVIPGRATVLWFEVPEPGRHPVYCAEMCGVGHSTMRAEVIALPPAEYERRLAGLSRAFTEAPLQSLAAMGERAAARRGCMRCHTPDGTPHIGPTFAGLYGATIPLEGGTRVIADEAYLTSSMMDPAAQLHRGFPAVMPSYQGLLTAAEVGALVEYIRSLRDVPRRDGDQPLPMPVPGAVPLVHPLDPQDPQEAPP